VSLVDGNDLQNDVFDDVEPLSEQELADAVERCVPVKVGWARFGDWELVGNGSVTDAVHCATTRYIRGCVRIDLHNRDVDGVDYTGKVALERVFMSCDKPSCPRCYYKGWAYREAGKIEARLLESGKRWGLPEHIVVSPSARDYGLPYESLLAKAVKFLFELGVVGGVLLFHPARYDDVRHWYFSPHFHILGHIAGGYRCRDCKCTVSECRACDLFVNRRYRLHERSGWIFKVLGKRKSVFGTACYQLEHSAFRVGSKRANVARWFGVCSYRKLKVTVEKRRRLCPICDEEFGKVLALCGIDDVPRGRGVLFDDMFGSDGLRRYAEIVSDYGG
jgi:hypothetical protein